MTFNYASQFCWETSDLRNVQLGLDLGEEDMQNKSEYINLGYVVIATKKNENHIYWDT